LEPAQLTPISTICARLQARRLLRRISLQHVAHLEAFGIRDRNLWRLQELVAHEVEALHRGAESGGGR